VHIRSVGLYHDKAEGMEKGKTSAFILEMDGLNIVHLGDVAICLAPGYQRIGSWMYCSSRWGRLYAQRHRRETSSRAIETRQYIIPMHFGTPVFEDVLRRMSSGGSSKRQGFSRSGPQDENTWRVISNELIVETNFKPTAPVIVLLNWQAKKSES